MKNYIKENGITLIALVITIVILIILAGVTINMTIGENGILTKAKLAKQNYENAQVEESEQLNNLYNFMSNSQEKSDLIYFNLNGGKGEFTPQSITDKTLKKINNSIYADNRDFYKWNTKSDGTGDWYEDGASINFDSSITLYAIWLADWIQPNIDSYTTYGNITQSNNYGLHYGYYAFNGIIEINNKWLSDSTQNGWLQWQMEEKIIINSFKVYATGETTDGNRAPKTIQLLGSNDGVNYTKIAEYENTQNLNGSEFVEITVEKPDVYIFYKWNFPDGNLGGNYGIAIGNIEINAKKIIKGELVEETWQQTHPNSVEIITASSTYNTHYAYYAFDGIVGEKNKWLSDSTQSGWLQWQMEEKIKISSFKLYGTGESNFGSRAPKTIQLLGSNDGVNYTKIAEYENTQNLNGSEFVEITVEKPDFYMFYKWNFPDGNLGGNVGIAVGNIDIKATVLH